MNWSRWVPTCASPIPSSTSRVTQGQVTRVECNAEELAAADAVVMLTNHDAFDVKAIVENASYVLDCRRAVPAGDQRRISLGQQAGCYGGVWRRRRVANTIR